MGKATSLKQADVLAKGFGVATVMVSCFVWVCVVRSLD
jgi:hypothetical protein